MEKYAQPISELIEKKSKTWIWILIILILVVIGIVAYFLFSGGDTSPAVNVETNVGGSIPKPPALP